jgi:hypothetical protein
MLRVNSRLMLLAVIALLTVPAALSQAVSFTPTFSPNFSQTHADFNFDGEEDFVVFYGCPSNAFGLVLSNGNGTYAPPVCADGGQQYVFSAEFARPECLQSN